MKIKAPTDFGVFEWQVDETKDAPVDVVGGAAADVEVTLIERSSSDRGFQIEFINHSSSWIKIRYRTAQVLCSGWFSRNLRPNRTKTIEIPAHQIGVCEPFEAEYLKKESISEEWTQTDLKGIFYRWGGQFSNLLYIKNENDEWARIEYNDGSRWRSSLVPPNSDHTCETLADNSGTLLFRWRN